MPEPLDTGDSLKGIQRDAKRLLSALAPVARLKPDAPDAIERLGAAVDALPSTDSIKEAVEDLRRRAEDLVRRGRAGRERQVRQSEAAFLTRARDGGQRVREVAEGWRVGPIEIQIRRSQGQARALFNREPLTAWSAIGTNHLADLFDQARKRLEAAALREDLLPDLIRAAHDQAQQAKGSPKSGGAVALLDLYRELRLLLLRSELAAGKPDKKLSYGEFPKWAFLYNLDRYRKLSGGHADVVLETGSQHDQQRGLGMVLNGLDPNEDYRTYCYARRSDRS